MAEHKKDDKKKSEEKKPTSKKHHTGGEMNFGIEILIFLVILFIIWALMGKTSENADKPFIKTSNTSIPQ